MTNDSTTIVFLSPLLKSDSVENLYYIQRYAYQKTRLEDNFDVWILIRGIDAYTIEKNKITTLGTTHLSADIVQ